MNDVTAPTDPPTLLTVGHGTASRDELIALLSEVGVERLVDVRRFPGSRRHPHVAREALERWVPEAGIAYRWEERLGGRRRADDSGRHAGLRNASFRAYAHHLETDEFQQALTELLDEADRAATAVMCSESLWWRCHRRMIADAVTALHGREVTHLMHDGRHRAHVLTDVARVEDGALRYDGGHPPLSP